MTFQTFTLISIWLLFTIWQAQTQTLGTQEQIALAAFAEASDTLNWSAGEIGTCSLAPNVECLMIGTEFVVTNLYVKTLTSSGSYINILTRFLNGESLRYLPEEVGDLTNLEIL